MSFLSLFVVIEVLIGAVVMLFAIIRSLRLRAAVPVHLRMNWLVIVVLMVFFFFGYLFFIVNLLGGGPIPLELVTGTIFMGGAFFVYVCIHISDISINEIQKKSEHLEAEIAERDRREEEKYRYQEGLEVLDRCTRRLIATAPDRDVFLRTLCDGLRELVHADLAIVPLDDGNDETFTYQAACGRNAEMVLHRTMPKNDGGLCGWVFHHAETLCIPDLHHDFRVKQDVARALGVTTGVTAPLFRGEQVAGGLSAFRAGDPFDQVDAELLTLFSQRVSIAFANMKLLEDLEQRVIARTAQLRENQARLTHLAHHDPLTDLPNRLLFEDRLKQAIAKARRAQETAALLFFDLDRFKEINDSLGHSVGDLVLCEVVRRLRAVVRESDTVARLGGDEFVIILEQVDGEEGVAEVARKVIQAMALPLSVAGREIALTGSIGISLYPDDGADVDALMKTADDAMYRAKALGRNNFQFYRRKSPV
jgi:diguanylate cyclase (GGDEF)-like protein